MRTPGSTVLVAALILSLASCAGSPPAADGPAAEPDAKAALVAVLRAQQAAWNAGDVEAFMQRGYWDSERMTFLSGGTWTRGYEPVMARFKRRYTADGAEMGRLAFTEVETLALAPDAGLARGRWRLEFSDGSGAGGLFTLLLRRFADGSWRIVHDHTSSDEPG